MLLNYESNKNEDAAGMVIVADNATIHKTKEVEKLLQEYQTSLLTIAPYSPWLNPAEKYINAIKSNIKSSQN
jgi:transposase